ncbi:MAG: tetratricopeptide repeat protein [Deferribacteres bacterium]|nr:tetratricopeptide repeat protein [Deferribacteres bacterium]
MFTGQSTGDGGLRRAGTCLSAGCLVLGLFLALLSYGYAASETIFTIQAGSFRSRPDAFRQFDLLQRKLSAEGREYLRVEKIGKFHAVRLGKFEDRLEAEEFLSANKSVLRGAIVMNAYFIPARIERLYKGPLPPAEEVDEGGTPPAAGGETGVKIPETVEEQIGMISGLFEKQDYENALRVVKAAVAKRPDDPELNAWYGTILLKMNHPDEAMKYFKKAADLLPDISREEQIRMISDLLEKHEYENALRLAKTAVMTKRPDDAELNAWYGSILLKMDQPEEAIKYFRKASELQPDVSDYYSGIGYCLSFSGRFEEAIDEFSKALALEPDNIDALTGLGVAYAKTGRKGQAMDVYMKLKGIESETAEKLLQIIERQP